MLTGVALRRLAQAARRPAALPRCIGAAPAERLQSDVEWRRFRSAMEADYPCLGSLRAAMRSCGLVQQVYRRAVHDMLQNALEVDVLAQAAVFRDAGHEIPAEDLLCLIPTDLLSGDLAEEIEAIASDVRVAQQKAEAKRQLLIQQDKVDKADKAEQTEAEKQESKRRRRFCRSTHDKTRQEMHRHYEKPW